LLLLLLLYLLLVKLLLLLCLLLLLLLLLLLSSPRLRSGRIVLWSLRSRRVPWEMRDLETRKLSLPDLILSRSASAPRGRHSGSGG